MKFSSINVLILINHLNLVDVTFSKLLSVSSALCDVIDEFFIKSEIFDFEIVVVSRFKKEKWKIDEILNGI